MPPRSDKSTPPSLELNALSPEGAAQPKPALKSFEKGLEELEAIVQELERGELTLEDSILLFEKGMTLSNACREQLAEAETRVEILLRKGGKMVPEPFPGSAAADNRPREKRLSDNQLSGAASVSPASGNETINDDNIPF
jgi:exodeoxyribonuclease VII small subunit